MAKTHATNIEKKAPPADPFTSLRSEMNKLFDDYFSGFGRYMPAPIRDLSPVWWDRGNGAISPAVDVSEDDKEITLTAELPGIEDKDIEVVLRDDMLTIKGEKKSAHEEKKEDFYLSERSYGAFERSFRMPETADTDKIDANFEKGVLTVHVAKKAAAKKAEKKIRIGK